MHSPILSPENLSSYEENGFLMLARTIDLEAIHTIISAIELICQSEHPGHVKEKDVDSYRALHGCHLYDPLFRDLIRSPAILEIAKQLLGEEVYLHQLKVNLKMPFVGESWPWHQDYIYWKNEDGIPTDNIVSAMIYLDEINEFNGPLFFIPNSHTEGCIEVTKPKSATGWESDVSNALSYQVPKETVERLVKKNGIFSAKGEKGDVTWFKGNLVHASPANLSPFKRRIVLLTYNAVSNVPAIVNKNKIRPEFLNGRDHSALTPFKSQYFS
jgi:ectoine hydroxylase-related dioxygenase (phytanoyl-CoA dioxygenase family)